MWLQVPRLQKSKEILAISMGATSTTASGSIKRPIRAHRVLFASLERIPNGPSSRGISALRRNDGLHMSNHSLLICLRLKCYYAHCPGSPPYECEFFTSAGSQIPKESNKTCRILIPNHRVLYGNTTTSYNCTLTRKDRKEYKYITIDYSIRQGRS